MILPGRSMGPAVTPAQAGDSRGMTALGCVGGGKGRRHVKLYSVNDIESKHLAHYIPLALEAARADS